MPTKVNVDYSRYPVPIQEVMPWVEGELAELRNSWNIYRFLFMESEGRTKLFMDQFGPLLGVLQNLLGKEMILSIARLASLLRGICLRDGFVNGPR
jgi:hypothetical protein